jgi:REP element-mobilizing transposase RayT
MRNSTMPCRRSLRLQGYDYAMAGAYFVTICTQDRACLFGDVVGGAMCLNEAGEMAVALWDGIASQFSGVEVDQFVVMPNHLHGILVLLDGDAARATTIEATTIGATTTGTTTIGATTRVAPTVDRPVGAPLVGARVVGACVRAPIRLGDVVGAFKSMATVGYIGGVKARGWPEFRGRLWQRNYYEHIIRDEAALDRIRRYIDDNPARWEFDDDNPRKTRPSAGPAGESDPNRA